MSILVPEGWPDREPEPGDPARSRLGDACPVHDPMTAPVIYPSTVNSDLHDSLRAEYRCSCGHHWLTWWHRRSVGWALEDLDGAA